MATTTWKSHIISFFTLASVKKIAGVKATSCVKFNTPGLKLENISDSQGQILALAFR